MRKAFQITAILVFIGSNMGLSQELSQYFDGEDTLCDQSSFYSSICVTIDNSPNNIWQIGAPNKSLFDMAASVPNVLVTDTLNYYPANNTSSFEFFVKPWSATPWGILAIQWKQKLDMKEGDDGGKVEFSIDGGMSWFNAFNNPNVYNFYGYQPVNEGTFGDGHYGFTGRDSLWRDVWLCYDLSWTAMDTILVKMTFISDSVDTQNEGWMIDNMMAHITWIHTIEENESESYMNVFPSPSSDQIFIETKKIQGYHIIEHLTLTNALGQVVDEWKRVPTKFFIDAKKYTNGTYYLTAKTNIETVTVPVIIEHN